jgi:hypothetical protein
VARAKRTERAAARRRYRAVTGYAPEADAEAIEAEAPAAGPARATPARVAASPDGRLPIGAALRASVHPLRAREDVAALPSLIRHRATWIPVAVTIVGAAVVAASGLGNGTALGVVGLLLFQYFLFPPALGGPFLVGFLAPRASWLLGAIVGLVAAAAYTVLIVAFPGQITAAVPQAEQVQTAVLSAFILSPIMGALFASAAAWYRRFLQLTNPNRGRRAQPPQKRQGDGRTRGAPPKGGAKATARR